MKSTSVMHEVNVTICVLKPNYSPLPILEGAVIEGGG